MPAVVVVETSTVSGTNLRTVSSTLLIPYGIKSNRLLLLVRPTENALCDFDVFIYKQKGRMIAYNIVHANKNQLYHNTHYEL